MWASASDNSPSNAVSAGTWGRRGGFVDINRSREGGKTEAEGPLSGMVARVGLARSEARRRL